MAAADNPYPMRVRLVIIGDSGVGKSCLVHRYTDASFSLTILPTTIVDFNTKSIQLGGMRIKFEIFDMTGKQSYRSIITSYFRGSQGIVLVYDVTDKQTFASIRNWIAEIQKHADVNANKILIGNKCDMSDQRAVTTAEGEALANEYNIKFFETSAKQDISVEDSFIAIATDVKDRMTRTL